MRTRTTLVSLLFGTALLVAMAVPAAAQGTDTLNSAAAIAAPETPSTAPAATAVFRTTGGASFYTPESAATPAAPAASGDKMLMPFVEGGLLHSSGVNGFAGGGGVTFLPVKDRPEVGVLVDAMFGHASEAGQGVNFFIISANGVFRFKMQNAKVVPFAGAGIGIVHASSGGVGDTTTRFQILFGGAFPVGESNEFSASLRIIFTAGSSTLLVLAGYSF